MGVWRKDGTGPGPTLVRSPKGELCTVQPKADT